MRRANIDTKLILVSPKMKNGIERSRRKMKALHIIDLIFVYIFLIVAAILILFPFYYMVVASMMTMEEIESGKIFINFASFLETAASNYAETFTRLNYFHHVGTTLLVSLSTTALQLLTTILAAFAFAKLTFRGRDILFIFFLATMMVPGELLAITNYTTLSNLGLTGLNQTYFQAILAMVLPLIASSFYIYLLRQNFMQIPNELYLASKVDGTSDWKFLWKVMVPIASPTIITVTILSLISGWNNYVWPNLVVYNDADTLISVIIRKGYLTFEAPGGIAMDHYGWQMAASVLTVVPLLILFIIFRKYIMKGNARGGIKG